MKCTADNITLKLDERAAVIAPHGAIFSIYLDGDEIGTLATGNGELIATLFSPSLQFDRYPFGIRAGANSNDCVREAIAFQISRLGFYGFDDEGEAEAKRKAKREADELRGATRERMRALDMNQERAAAMLETTQATISRALNGKIADSKWIERLNDLMDRMEGEVEAPEADGVFLLAEDITFERDPRAEFGANTHRVYAAGYIVGRVRVVPDAEIDGYVIAFDGGLGTVHGAMPHKDSLLAAICATSTRICNHLNNTDWSALRTEPQEPETDRDEDFPSLADRVASVTEAVESLESSTQDPDPPRVQRRCRARALRGRRRRRRAHPADENERARVRRRRRHVHARARHQARSTRERHDPD